MSEWDKQEEEEFGDEEEYCHESAKTKSWWKKAGFDEFDLEYLGIKTRD